MPPEDDDPLAKPVPEPPHPILNAPVPPPPSAILSAPVPEPPSTNLIPIPSPKVTRFSVAKDMEPSPLDRQLSKAPDALGTGVGSKPPGLSWGEVLDAAASGGVMAPEYRREPSIWNPIEDYNRIVPETPVAKLVGGAMDTMGAAIRPIATIANQILPDKAPPFTPFWRPEWPPDWKHLLVGKLPETNIGDTLTAAAKSIPPEWAGRDTSKDVDTSKVISKVLPDPVDIYGELSGNKSGAIVDPQTGDVSIGAGLAHLARGVRDFYVTKHVDPVMQLHPGMSEGAKIDVAARSDALRNIGEGMKPVDAAYEFSKQTGQPAPLEILDAGKFDQAGRETFSNPNTSDLVNRGQLGLNFEGYGPVPKAFLPIPKAVVPAFKVLQPLFDMMASAKSTITGEAPRSANQVVQKVNENEARAAIGAFNRAEVLPIVRQIQRGELPQEAAEQLGNLMEAQHPNGHSRNEVEPNLAQRLKDDDPTMHAEIVAGLARSAARFDPQVQAVNEYVSTLPTKQQATFVDVAPKVAALPAKMRTFAAMQGPRSINIPRLNADILDLPNKIQDVREAIDRVIATKPFEVKATPGSGSDAASGLREFVAKEHGEQGVDTAELTKLIEDLRTEKPRELVAVKPGEFPERAPGSPAPEPWSEPGAAPMNPADALTKRRLNVQAKATQTATGTPDEFSRLNELSRQELVELKNKLTETMPLAIERYNSVPTWRPSRLSELGKDELAGAKENLNIRKPGVGMNPEDAERGGLLRDLDKEKYGRMGNVKQTVYEGNKSYSKGTAATEGRSVLDPKGKWATIRDKFLSTVGITDLERLQAYNELDPLKAVVHELDWNYFKAMTSSGIDAHVARTMAFPKTDTVQALQGAFYDGIETGEKYDKAKPTYWHSQKGALIADATGKSGNNYLQEISSRRSWEPPTPNGPSPVPPWEYKPGTDWKPLRTPGSDPLMGFAYPGMARFKEMAWGDLTKLADEGNPAARQEVAMRMEPLSQGQSKTQGLQRIGPNTRDPFYTGSRQSVESPVTPANPLTPEQNPLGGLGDEPFQPRTYPFEPPIIPRAAPKYEFFDFDQPLRGEPLPATPGPKGGAPIKVDPNTTDPFYTGARQTVETPTTPPKPAVRQAQRTGGVDPFTPDATHWASYEVMDWKDLGERARNGDPAARQEMARRVEPRSVKNAPMPIDANTRDPFYTGSRQTVETPTTPPRPEMPRHEPSGPLPSNPMFSEGPRTQPQSIGPNEPKYAPLTEEKKMTRPPTLADAEAIWKAGGEKGLFYDRLNADAKKKLAEGVPFHEVVDRKWTPDNMARADLDGQSGYIHAGVARELNEYKRLGQDPMAIARYMRQNLPLYTAILSGSKKLSTIYNPAFPAYMLMKQVHDQVRATLGGLTDAQYPQEVLAGQQGHLAYRQNGRTDMLLEYISEGGVKVGGEAAARELERAGQLDRAGTEFGEYKAKPLSTEAAPAPDELQFGDFGSNSKNPIKQAKQLGGDLQEIIVAQDNANRAAAYFARRRAGDTPGEAAFKVDKAFFDFRRKGPLTQAMSQTVIPFAGWHAKVIPFMLDWMVKNPGEFMLVQKALQQANAGMIPASQLPQMIRDGTNIPLSTRRDATGKQFVTTMNVNGMVPGTEAINFANDVMRHGGLNWLQQHLAGPIRALIVAGKLAAQDEEDPERNTAGEEWGKVAHAFVGRPGTIGATLTDPNKTPGQQANMLLNPMTVTEWEESGGKHSQDQISIYSARRGVRSAQRTAAEAQQAIQDEITKFVAAHKELAQAEAVKLSESDPLVIDARRKDAEARARVQRETEYFTKKALPELQDTKRKLQLFSPSFVP